MYKGSYFVPKPCKKSLKQYVDRYKHASYFEVIGVVDALDFEAYRNIEKHQNLYETIGIHQLGIDELKKFSHAGLAQYRAREASWIIKAHTKKMAVTHHANYHVVSKSGQKGFVVRAYK
jgi:hypothetical protein